MGMIPRYGIHYPRYGNGYLRAFEYAYGMSFPTRCWGYIKVVIGCLLAVHAPVFSLIFFLSAWQTFRGE